MSVIGVILVRIFPPLDWIRRDTPNTDTFYTVISSPKSKLPRYFKKLLNKIYLIKDHYFANPRAWMDSQNMEAELTRIYQKLKFQNRKVICFSKMNPVISILVQIKLRFVSKFSTSCLQPLDAGIIRGLSIKSCYLNI